MLLCLVNLGFKDPVAIGELVMKVPYFSLGYFVLELTTCRAH